jgi:outer membrane protein assembly factor BamB
MPLHSRRAIYAIALIGWVGASTPGLAEQWSRFRGPNGSGIAPSGEYPTELNDRSLVWKRPMAPGKSSPVLTPSRIFLTSAEAGKLVVHCLDRKTGKTIWERFVLEQRREFQHPLNSSASSTPVTDGKNVYAYFGNFGLISFTETGQERWRVPLGPFSSVWGMASSPVLASGNVVLLLDGFSSSYIAAFNMQTGRQVWKSTRQPFAMNYSTPVIRRLANGVEEILALGPRQIVAYDAESGSARRSSEIPGGVMIASPVFGDDLAYAMTYALESVPSFEDQLKKLDANRDGKLTPEEFGSDREHARVLQTFGSMYGNRDHTVERDEWVGIWSEWSGKPAITAVRLDVGEQAVTSSNISWRYERNVPRVPSPLLMNGVLYVVSSGGILTTLDAKTGAALNVGRLTGAIDNYFASPVATGSMIYMASESGKIVVLRSGREWTILALNDLRDECYATPALSGGQIFIRTATSLWAFTKQ